MLQQLEEDFRYTIQKHVAITAGAGTGKTYTLSRRYVNAILGFDFYTLNAKEFAKKYGFRCRYEIYTKSVKRKLDE